MPSIQFKITNKIICSNLVWKLYEKKKYQLESRRGERQNKLRKYWTTHENFITIYDCVYAAMVDAKVAIPLGEPD